MKKYILGLLLASILLVDIDAQVPEKFNYQAIVRDDSGELISNTSVAVVISIIQGTITGDVVFTETHAVETNAYGLVTLEIGTKNTVDFANIDWSSGSFFISINVNGSELGMSQLISVPFALYAKDTDIDGEESAFQNWDKNVSDDFSGSYSNLTNVPDVFNPAPHTHEEIEDLLTQIDELESIIYNSGIIKVTDIDGNEYDVVKIGEQVWMAENLKVTHFPDGSSIPQITDIDGDGNTYNEWAALADNDVNSAFCYYNDDPNGQYGVMYTYAAATKSSPQYGTNITQGVCPNGWHLPSDAEWEQLIEFVGETNAGKYLKSDTGWYDNGNGTNEFGFSALPGGYRSYHDGKLSGLGENAIWWSCTSDDSDSAFERYFSYDKDNILRQAAQKSGGIYVRCIKD